MKNKDEQTFDESGAPVVKVENHLQGLYKNWFLEYASYVILDRAVPYYEDGLKPVQRRILHTLFEMHDGRHHKIANVIGQTMKYHPHGDASIGDALVGLGQKDLLIDMQGNWGNPSTGDSAAAPRYIEGRLTQFALDVLFNPETTDFVPSYDGRSKEPITLPVKFPLLLAQGVEGIAVGLSTTILPHNFCELLEASIAYLRGRKFDLYPDFPGGGIADVSNYNDGLRGGKVKVRAKIEKSDNRTLVISEIPYGTTTGSLIESIVAANDKGKIKIKKVDDNTAAEVEVVIHLAPGSEPQVVIDALFAFTDCEKSLSPNSCIIVEKKPAFLSVTEILKKNTDHTVRLLEWELKNRLDHLQSRWHMTSLEKIFIEQKVYSVIEKAHDKEEMVTLIQDGLKPFIKKLRREISREDVLRLGEIPVRRTSLYDKKKTDELLIELDTHIGEVQGHLMGLVDYAVNWFKDLLKKYGKGRERRTELAGFEKVSAVHVAIANQKLYVNAKEGFMGTSLKKEEFLFDVSEYDDIIVFKADASFMVVRVSEKAFVGKDVIRVERFNKDDERHIYNLVYQDGKDGPSYVKRFNVGGITRDKEYPLGKSTPGTKVLYLSSNPNGEAEVVEVVLKPRPRIKLNFEVDFSEVDVKGRGAGGNQITKYPIRIVKKSRTGVSTLGARVLYFDANSGVVGSQKKGEALGEFEKSDKVFVVRKNGIARIYDFSDPILVGTDVLWVGRFDPESVGDQIFSILYFDGANFTYYVKRFTLEGAPSTTDFSLITDHADSRLIEFFDDLEPKALVEYQTTGKEIQRELLDLTVVADVKSYKALGSKFTAKKVRKVMKAPETVVSGEQTPEEALKKEKPLELDLFR
jgi:topoisomerase-4 subunit A